MKKSIFLIFSLIFVFSIYVIDLSTQIKTTKEELILSDIDEDSTAKEKAVESLDSFTSKRVNISSNLLLEDYQTPEALKVNSSVREFKQPEEIEELIYVSKDRYIFEKADEFRGMSEADLLRERYTSKKNLSAVVFDRLQENIKQGIAEKLYFPGYEGEFKDFPNGFEGKFKLGMRVWGNDPDYIYATSLPYKGNEELYHRKWNISLINQILVERGRTIRIGPSR